MNSGKLSALFLCLVMFVSVLGSCNANTETQSYDVILSISLDTFSTQNSKQVRNHLSEMEQISMERSGMDICSISGAARSGG